jgi:hypothetical protein
MGNVPASLPIEKYHAFADQDVEKRQPIVRFHQQVLESIAITSISINYANSPLKSPAIQTF